METIASIFGFFFGLIKLAIFLAIVLGGVALWGYNALRRLSEGVKAAWSNTGVISARMTGEVNQMIEIASTVQNNEKFTYLKMSENMTAAAMASVQSQSASVMANLSELAQRYPELASNRQFTSAMESVRQCQGELAAMRQAYNRAAQEYNLTRTSIPHVFYSGVLGFKDAPYLDQQAMKAGDAADRPLMINDDGERINALLRNGGAAAAGATRQLGERAKLLLEKATAPNGVSTIPVSPTVENAEYLYLDAQLEAKGPVTLSGLAALRSAGVIQPQTKVFHPADQRWMEYQQMAELVKA